MIKKFAEILLTIYMDFFLNSKKHGSSKKDKKENRAIF
jgi:hypothetical protein